MDDRVPMSTVVNLVPKSPSRAPTIGSYGTSERHRHTPSCSWSPFYSPAIPITVTEDPTQEGFGPLKGCTQSCPICQQICINPPGHEREHQCIDDDHQDLQIGHWWLVPRRRPKPDPEEPLALAWRIFP